MTTRRITIFLLLALAAPFAVWGEDCHSTATEPATADVDAGAGETFAASIPDVELVDQDGRAVRFADLARDRVVAINFIFTTCTTICPPMGANFAKLQTLLGDRLGEDAGLISISVDPAVDTPQRLKAWGEVFSRGENWTLLTGEKLAVDRLLKALKVFTPEKTDHSPIVLVGDPARGDWNRAYGLAPPATLAAMVEEMLNPETATVEGP